jgi:hypothetical protein
MTKPKGDASASRIRNLNDHEEEREKVGCCKNMCRVVEVWRRDYDMI